MKFYFFDVGVYRSLRPTGPFDPAVDIEGVALETLFFQELRAVNDYFRLGYNLYFWLTQSKLEVDFVLYGGSEKLYFGEITATHFVEAMQTLPAVLRSYINSV